MNDSDVNIIKANRLLQAKVGTGEVDEKKVIQSQSIIEKNQTDFAPMAHEFLDQLDQTLASVPENPANVKESIQPVIIAVMQIKANAGMFNYTLVGSLAGIVLNFLENLRSWDKDCHTIVDAHSKTLRLIVSNGMKGDGGTYGAQLVTELRDACNRYYNKKAASPSSDGDIVFIDG